MLTLIHDYKFTHPVNGIKHHSVKGYESRHLSIFICVCNGYSAEIGLTVANVLTDTSTEENRILLTLV